MLCCFLRFSAFLLFSDAVALTCNEAHTFNMESELRMPREEAARALHAAEEAHSRAAGVPRGHAAHSGRATATRHGLASRCSVRVRGKRGELRCHLAGAALRAGHGEDHRHVVGVRGALEATEDVDLEAARLLDVAARRAAHDATLLHVSGYALVAPEPRAAVLDLVATARRRGIPVTIDPGSAGFLRQIGPEAFLRWTSGAAMCFPNADEAATLAATEDRDEQLRCLSDIYGLLVVKRGAAGAEATNRHGDYWAVPAKPAAVRDTTGAGDAFLAAFLASYVKGASIPICLARGVEAGSRATEFYGGRPGGDLAAEPAQAAASREPHP